MKDTTLKSLDELCDRYRTTMEVMETGATNAIRDEGRAYGGFIRMAKGKFQEWLTQRLVEITWESELGESKTRLEINSKKIPIPIQMDYVGNLQNTVVKAHLEKNQEQYKYGLSVDKHVFIDNRFVLGIESKAYTENAMIKRILVDFYLLKTKHPDLACFLFQLESQLGGDYSSELKNPMGSPATHTLMSYFKDVQLNIVTLLEGERKVDRPINDPNFFKELKREHLEVAVDNLLATLKPFEK
jgi:hypothetical protein